MYHDTCHIAPWLRVHFPPKMVASLSEHFDLLPYVDSVSFSCVGGVHLGVVTGKLGKTRFLERMKSASGAVPELPAPARCDFSMMSKGQQVFETLRTLCRFQPAESCLMVDDLLDALDLAHINAALSLLRDHPRHVVLTVSPRMMPMVQNLVRDAEVVFVDLDAII